MSRQYSQHIRSVEDFPKPGVQFYDIAPLIGNGMVFRSTVHEMAEPLHDRVTKVAAFDARGFVFGATVALELGVGLVMLRKPGKLPGNVHNIHYELEYGEASLEIQESVLSADDRVVLIDDVIATGGTALAGIQLVLQTGAEIVEFCSLIDLPHLQGSQRIKAAGVPVRALVELGEAS